MFFPLHYFRQKKVGRIQMKILQAIQQLGLTGTQDAISRLNSDLLDITQVRRNEEHVIFMVLNSIFHF